MVEMTVGGLFSGVGGIELGLQRAGMRIEWMVENEPFCNRVLERHWPDVRRYGDVRTVGRHNLAPVSLIAGGFPCTPHSVAGKRRGAEDHRNLWPEFLRIVKELRPAYVFAENVPGIVSLYLDTVLADLEGEGYTCWAFNIPAVAFNAPHRRERIFVVAHANSGSWSHREVALKTSRDKVRWPQEQARGCHCNVAYSNDYQQEQSQCDYITRERTQKSWQSIGARASSGVVCGNNAQGNSWPRGNSKEMEGDVAHAEGQPRDGGDDNGGGRPRQISQSRDGVEEGRPIGGWPGLESPVGRTFDGLPARMDGRAGLNAWPDDWEYGVPRTVPKPDTKQARRKHKNRLQAVGNAVLPQEAEWIGRQIMDTEMGRHG